MTARARLAYLSVFAAALLVCGCATTKPQQFRTFFLPPSHPTASAPTINEPPPAVTPNLFLLKESPTFLSAQSELPLQLTQVDARIMRADERFQAGKKLYHDGDLDGARREFDKAIDILLNTSESVADRQRIEKKLDELADAIYRYDMEGLGSGEGQDQVVFDKSPLDDILQMTFPIDPRLKNQVREEVNVTVSQLPLEENDAVLSFIHYFSTDRGRRVLLSGLRRAGRYQPLISRILQEEGVPQELIFLAQAESGFLPRAVSRKSATGMWQFVKFRGNEYGLMQTAGADDRLDPEKATRAAAKHLHDLYNHFGDWYLALAAYNCGPGCVDKAVQRTGYADYWELRSRNVLPKETANYVPVILAMTIMAKNPKDYDLVSVDADPPLEYDTLEITVATNLALIGDAVDRSVSEIRDLNPSLLGNVAPAGHQLHVPKGTGSGILAAIEKVPSGNRAAWRMHRVVTGDTLAEIAKRYSTSTALIAAANPGSRTLPEAGAMMMIPAAYYPARTPVRRTYAASSRKTTSSPRTVARPKASTTAKSKGATASAAAHSTPKAPAKKAIEKQPAAYQTASLHKKKAAGAE